MSADTTPPNTASLVPTAEVQESHRGPQQLNPGLAMSSKPHTALGWALPRSTQALRSSAHILGHPPGRLLLLEGYSFKAAAAPGEPSG